MPLGGVLRQSQASRQTIAQCAPVRGRHVDGGNAQRLNGINLCQRGAYLFFAFHMQQQARTRLHAGDALHRVQRGASLHHHELPARSAVVVGLPAHTAKHGHGQEHGAAPPTVKLERPRRLAKAQIKVETLVDVSQRNAGQWHVAGLAGQRGK